MCRPIVLLALVLFVGQGCSPPPPRTDAPEATQHHFGRILTSGQTLTHRFVVSNRGDRPLKILDAHAMTPCCSSIGPVPDRIPARGRIEVPVEFRPADEPGPKRVRFFLETDSQAVPVRFLEVSADLLPAVEIDRIDGDEETLFGGRGQERTYRVVSRKRGAEGRGLPTEISGSGPVVIGKVGAASRHRGLDGLEEQTFEVDILIPGPDRPGEGRAEVMLAWGDTPDAPAPRRLPIRWTTPHRIRAEPPGVVASVGEPLERTVVLASPDHPFRVTGFAAPAGVGSSLKILSEIGSRHEVLLSVAATTGPGAHSIEFTTDDPSQPSVRLTLLLLAREANDATN